MRHISSETEQDPQGTPWGEGYDAYRAGSQEGDNPYPLRSDSRKEWYAGFDAAERTACETVLTSYPQQR